MRTLILGAGVSGLAAARLALRRGERVVLHDPDPAAAAGAVSAGFAVAGGEWSSTLLEGVDLVVASPGVPERSEPVVATFEAGIPLVGELEAAWRMIGDVPTVAVTGTNGKTTVTSVVSAMLEESGLRAPALGNIGDPLSDAVDAPPEVVVVEVSSFQLRFTETFAPRVAVVTNVAPDHLDWHGSFRRYMDAKARIVANQHADDLLVYDGADPGAVEIAARAPGRTMAIDPADPRQATGCDEAPVLAIAEVRIPFHELAVSDRPFLADLAMAGAAALEMGAAPAAVGEVARRFRPGSHRRTQVAVIGGIGYVDDSKATNPHAALAAIRSYPSVVLIAGGIDKGLDVSPLAKEPNVRSVVAIGTSAPALLDAAGTRGVEATTMDQAVRMATERARSGDVVLLAPGCSSFDMFTSYGQRGEEFIRAVDRLREEGAS